MHFWQIAPKCLLTYIYWFFSHCMMVQSGPLVPARNPSVTFMLQNFDADLKWSQGLHWRQPRNCFFAQETSKILRQLWVFRIAFLFSLLPFASRLLSRLWKKKLVTKTDQFCTAQWQVENSASESDCVTWVRLVSSHAEKK